MEGVEAVPYVFSVLFYIHLFVCVCRSEDNLQESVLSYHVGPGDGTRMVSLGSKHSPAEPSP